MGLPPPPPPPPDGRSPQDINLAARLPDGSWLNADFRYPPPPQNFFSRLGAAEIVLYLVVLSASLFFAARVIRPLNELASAASRFGRDRVDPIALSGPREVRTAVSSFNAMARRVSELLREKDHMIAAIGHDLRTPLAALRVRAEAVEPEAERERIIDSIDDISKMVEDILSLARPASAGEPFAIVDLSALAESLVEEFCDLGKTATFADAPRTPLSMQPSAVKRLIRNLIENAIKFGGRAEVSIETEPGSVSLCVDDGGPGIPDAMRAHVKEAFVRLEGSRNRETGGIGLGLAIANAIAQSQNAQLDLINRPSGGLRARVTWTV
jgi:signal transduction histidine kinase